MNKETNMRRSRSNLNQCSVAVLIIICFIMIYRILYADQTPCSVILERAVEMQRDLHLQRPSRQVQLEKYQQIHQMLDGFDASLCSANLRLDIDTLKLGVEKKINALKADAVATPQPSPDWETLYRNCYRTYTADYELIRLLSCKEAADLINRYYDAAWDELQANKFPHDATYPPESVHTLWRLLYRISCPDCTDSAPVKTAVARVFFPHTLDTEKIIRILAKATWGASPDDLRRLLKPIEGLGNDEREMLMHLIVTLATQIKTEPALLQAMDPDRLNRALVNLLQEDPQRWIQLIGAMGHLEPAARLNLLSGFTEVAMGKQNAKIHRFLRMLSNLDDENQERIETALSMLHKVPWSLAPGETFVNIPKDKQMIVLVPNFMWIHPHSENDSLIAKAINDAFQQDPNKSHPEVPRAQYRIIRTRVKLKADLSAYDINDRVETLGLDPYLTVDEAPDVVLFGRLERQAGEDCLLHLHFVDRERKVLFRDRLVLPRTSTMNDAVWKAKASAAYERFLTFVTVMRLMDTTEAHATVKYIKGEKPAAFIQRAAASHTRIFGGADPSVWDSVRNIVIKPEFWGEDPEKAAIMGSGYEAAIEERLQALYFRSYSPLVADRKIDPQTLVIHGKYYGPAEQTSVASADGQIRLTLIFEIDHQPRATTDLYLPEKMIKEQQETIKQIVTHIACRSIAVFLNFKIGPPVIESHCPAAASFFMPGIWRTAREGPQATDFPLRFWNYSNFVLLGVTIGTEAAYIGSDYENDALFWTAVGGTGLFLINGSIGLMDALVHKRKGPTGVNRARSGIGLYPMMAEGGAGLALSIPF